MSFTDLTKDKLHEAADYYGVDYKATDNKATLVAELEGAGVTYDMYKADFAVPEATEDVKAAVAAVDEESTTVVSKNQVLIKMVRTNPVYEALGYRFERNRPFVLVDEEDVDYLIEVEGGFAVAKPSEVKEFYS